MNYIDAINSLSLENLNRRDFLKATGQAAAAAGINPSALVSGAAGGAAGGNPFTLSYIESMAGWMAGVAKKFGLGPFINSLEDLSDPITVRAVEIMRDNGDLNMRAVNSFVAAYFSMQSRKYGDKRVGDFYVPAFEFGRQYYKDDSKSSGQGDALLGLRTPDASKMMGPRRRLLNLQNLKKVSKDQIDGLKEQSLDEIYEILSKFGVQVPKASLVPLVNKYCSAFLKGISFVADASGNYVNKNLADKEADEERKRKMDFDADERARSVWDSESPNPFESKLRKVLSFF